MSKNDPSMYHDPDNRRMYLYGYDGSGLPMSCEVQAITSHNEVRTLIYFDGFIPPLDRRTELRGSETDERYRVVRDKNLRPIGEPIDPASFNYLD